jgi:hypothetical protein
VQHVEARVDVFEAAAPNGARISKNSPRIITEGGIPNIW